MNINDALNIIDQLKPSVKKVISVALKEAYSDGYSDGYHCGIQNDNNGTDVTYAFEESETATVIEGFGVEL